MPELPEVETARRELCAAMEGARLIKVVARRPDLRTPFPKKFASRLEGCVVRKLGRRGKYLIAELSSGETLVMHLGMSGSFRVESGPPVTRAAIGSHDHVVFVMSSGATVTFNDPRRFGFMTLIGSDTRHAALDAMGPEPLSAAFDAAALAAACRGKKTSLKVALLDQRVVAGIGNIYACEALHRARLSPRRRASTLATRAGQPRPIAVNLAAAIKTVLEDAIRGQAEGTDRFRVYDREDARCPRRGCTGTVKRIVQAGRSTFFCPICQR